MEKRSGKSCKYILAAELFLIVLCSVSIFLVNKETNINKRKYDFLVNEFEAKQKKVSSQKEKLSNLEKELISYTDIDESINTIKSDYFNSIKKLEDKILNNESDKKIAYITFDDGPYYNTYKVLDILDEANVKATFFTISANGQFCHDNKSENCFNLYNEYFKRGHTIANHTYTHAIFKGLYSSSDAFMDAIMKQEEHIKNLTGYTTNITRFPGGSASAKGLKDEIVSRLRDRGYGWVDWTAGDGDGGGLSSRDQAWGNFVSTINDKIEVILFHDYNKYTTEILSDAIKYLKENGYEIFPLFYESNAINK